MSHTQVPTGAASRRYRRWLGAVAAVALFTSSATAASVTLYFTGAGSTAGHTVEGALTYDSALPVWDTYDYGWGAYAIYYPQLSGSPVSVAYTLKDGAGNVVVEKTDADATTGVLLQVYNYNGHSGDRFGTNGRHSADNRQFSFFVSDAVGAMMPSTALPSTSAPVSTSGSWSVGNPAEYYKDFRGSTLTFSFTPPVVDVAALKAQIASLKVQLATANSTVTALNAELLDMDADLAAVQQQLTTANATIGTVNEARAALENDVSAKTAELAVAGNTITALTAEKASLTAELAAAKATIATLTAEKAALAASLATANASIAGLNGTVSTLQATLTDAQGAVAGLNQQKDSLSTQLAASTSTNAALVSELAAANGTIATQSATLSSQASALATLQAQVALQQATIAALTAKLATAFSDPAFVIPGATVEEQLTNLTSAIGALNNGQQQALYKKLGGKK